jgi:hypothetical protein
MTPNPYRSAASVDFVPSPDFATHCLKDLTPNPDHLLPLMILIPGPDDATHCLKDLTPNPNHLLPCFLTHIGTSAASVDFVPQPR